MTPATRTWIIVGGLAPRGAKQGRVSATTPARRLRRRATYTAEIQVAGAWTRLRDGAEELRARHC